VIDRRVKLTVGAGLLLAVAAIAIDLSQSPITVAAVNTAQISYLGSTEQPIYACQSGESLPRETSAVRLRAFSFFGPRVRIDVLASGHVIAHGERGSGWTGGAVTIPLNRLSTARPQVKLCFTFFLNGDETTEFVGELTAEALAAHGPHALLPGRVRVEYMRPDRSSWWSLVPQVARRMGLGHAGSGTWSVLLAAALMIGLALVCSRVALRELG
jgi:hypothetical protein